MTANHARHRGVCGEWSGVDLLLLENQDRTPLKVAITAAIMLHLILFWWNVWQNALPRSAWKIPVCSMFVCSWKSRGRCDLRDL